MEIAEALDFLMAKVALICAHTWTQKKAEAYEKDQLKIIENSTAHLIKHPIAVQMAKTLKVQFEDKLASELTAKKHSLEGRIWVDETALHHFENDWEARFSELESKSPTMADLFELDNKLEEAIKRQVPADCRFSISAFLTENYGIKRLNSRALKSATPKVLGDGWISLLPRADPPPLTLVKYPPEQIALMPPAMKELKRWTITATTVGELAQLYADYSGHEVRLEKSLLERPNQYVGGQMLGTVVFVEVIAGYLSINHTALKHRLGGIVDLHDTRARKEARRKKFAPQPATEQELNRARAAMSVDKFWAAIDAAKADDRDPQKFAKSLRRVAEPWTAEEVLGFNIRLEEALAQVYTWDIWGVAYLINGGCSDDGFLYFRLWLVSQGSHVFHTTLRDPSRIADFASSDQNNEFEELRYIAADLYPRLTKRPLPTFSNFLEISQLPSGQKWEEADLPKRFPRVFEKFG